MFIFSSSRIVHRRRKRSWLLTLMTRMSLIQLRRKNDDELPRFKIYISLLTDEASIDGEEGGKPPAPQRSGIENRSTLIFEGAICCLPVYLHPHHEQFQISFSIWSYTLQKEDFCYFSKAENWLKILSWSSITHERNDILKHYVVRMNIYR